MPFCQLPQDRDPSERDVSVWEKLDRGGAPAINKQPPQQSPVVARHQRLIFVDDMTTIEQLNYEIQALQEENDGYKKQFAEVIRKGIEEMAPGDKQSMIKFLDNRIGHNNALILKKKDQILEKITSFSSQIAAIAANDAAKEIENEKRITIAQQAATADKQTKSAIEIEKARQITADKEYRLQRGEITDSPITFT